jgi:hypothetical protein
MFGISPAHCVAIQRKMCLRHGVMSIKKAITYSIPVKIVVQAQVLANYWSK